MSSFSFCAPTDSLSLIQPADGKCSRCRGRCPCLLPVDSDNGHPACAECLISSHGCPNRVAHSTPAQRKPTRSNKGKEKAGPAPAKRPQVFILLPRLRRGSPASAGPSGQNEANPLSAPSAADLLAEYSAFSSRPMQERPPPGHGKLVTFQLVPMLNTSSRSRH